MVEHWPMMSKVLDLTAGGGVGNPFLLKMQRQDLCSPDRSNLMVLSLLVTSRRAEKIVKQAHVLGLRLG